MAFPVIGFVRKLLIALPFTVAFLSGGAESGEIYSDQPMTVPMLVGGMATAAPSITLSNAVYTHEAAVSPTYVKGSKKVRVKSYTRKSGVSVKSHTRSAPKRR